MKEGKLNEEDIKAQHEPTLEESAQVYEVRRVAEGGV